MEKEKAEEEGAAPRANVTRQQQEENQKMCEGDAMTS